MTNSVFAYPSNKARASEWILEHVPKHRLYVEPFGGAAGVLANKPPSHNEVYNDIDGDLVQFFHVLQQRGDELVDRLSPPLYNQRDAEEWGPKWENGWRPDDPVERAAVFFYLRCTSFGGKYRYFGGFARSRIRNNARTYANQVERLEAFANRFSEVVVTNEDWMASLDRWDGEDCLFYCDPPYIDTRPRYRHGADFDHGAFVDALADLTAKWVVSYGTLPDGLRELANTVVSRATKYEMGAGHTGEAEESTERLAMNFDPESQPTFARRQSALGSFSQGVGDD